MSNESSGHSSLLIAHYAIIVAGGSGLRMKTEVPKQFITISGKPILMHTMEIFYLAASKPQIILVLSPEHIQLWKNLCKKENFTIPHTLVEGGEQRFHSVRNALAVIPEGPAIIAVHDGVRPLVSEDIINKSFAMALEKGNAVTTISSRDSIRQLLQEGQSHSLKRDTIFLVQTPQTFKGDLLKKAYQQPYNSSFTDDASVVEYSGVNIHMIEGDIQNIKITYPEDLLFAQYILNSKKIPLNKFNRI